MHISSTDFTGIVLSSPLTFLSEERLYLVTTQTELDCERFMNDMTLENSSIDQSDNTIDISYDSIVLVNDDHDSVHQTNDDHDANTSKVRPTSDDSKPLINTVLCFIMHGINTGSAVNVHKIASETFTLAEVKSAADILWEHCDLGPRTGRKSIKARSECQATLNDVIIQLQELDTEGNVPLLKLYGCVWFKKHTKVRRRRTFRSSYGSKNATVGTKDTPVGFHC